MNLYNTKQLDAYKTEVIKQEINYIFNGFNLNPLNKSVHFNIPYTVTVMDSTLSYIMKWKISINDIDLFILKLNINIESKYQCLEIYSCNTWYSIDTINVHQFFNFNVTNYLFYWGVSIKSIDSDMLLSEILTKLNACERMVISDIISSNTPVGYNTRIKKEYICSCESSFNTVLFDHEYYVQNKDIYCTTYKNLSADNKQYFVSVEELVDSTICTMDTLVAFVTSLCELADKKKQSVIDKYNNIKDTVGGPTIICNIDNVTIKYLTKKTFMPIINNGTITFKSPYTDDIVTLIITGYSTVSIRDFDSYFADSIPLIVQQDTVHLITKPNNK